MTPLEKAISNLLLDCAKILKPEKIMKDKWQYYGNNSKRMITYIDGESSIRRSFFLSFQQVKNLNSFRPARLSYEQDEILAIGALSAASGYSFLNFFTYLISNTSRLGKGRIIIDVDRSLRLLRNTREVLKKKTIKFDATARLYGVAISAKSIELQEGVTLNRLTRKQRNDRASPLDSFSGYAHDEATILDQPTELAVSHSLKIDYGQINSAQLANGKAFNAISEKFSRAVDSMLFVKTGYIAIGKITITGDLVNLPSAHTIPKSPLPIVDVKIKTAESGKISDISKILANGPNSDSVLLSSIHRFILGRKRLDTLDRLVDYVISWESLLLTNKKSAIKHESVYRFSINGAAIIKISSRGRDQRDDLNKLKAAYNVRSTIVHGGGVKSIGKELRKHNFEGASEMCDYLEANYRSVVYWLISMDKGFRPYNRDGGWEDLIWRVPGAFPLSS